jgi:hypothetical protein
MLNTKKTSLTIILIVTFAFIFATEQNVNGAVHVKIDESSITDFNPINVATSIPWAAKRSQTLEANDTISSLIFLTTNAN